MTQAAEIQMAEQEIEEQFRREKERKKMELEKILAAENEKVKKREENQKARQ